MKARLLSNLALRDLASRKTHFAFALFGLAAGSATLIFFFALVQGVKAGVLNELFPVNLIEVAPLSSGLPFKQGPVIAPAFVNRVRQIPGVAAVFPKKKAQFQAILWGRLPLVAYQLHLEAFFDGIDPALVQNDITPRPKKHSRTIDFAFLGQETPCKGDASCPLGQRCLSGWCGIPCGAGCNGKCIDHRCLPACNNTRDCLPGRVCRKHVCQPLACRLDRPGDALSASFDRTRGRVTGLLFDPGAKAGGKCPGDTYCATRNLDSGSGVCEAPIPVVLSPLLTELYNSVASSAFHLPTLKDLSVLVGLRFRIIYGESYFVNNVSRRRQVVKQARIVGFSPEAIDLGVTMPMPYVDAANVRLRGRKAANRITSLLVRARTNEAVPGVVRELARYGLVPTPRYQASKRMADLLYILSLIFAAIALIVLLISAGGIAHVLLMLVHEKAVELALFRSLGATRWAIRVFVLFESLVIGLAGGVAGLLTAWAAAWVTDRVLLGHFAFLPTAPVTLFAFHWWICLVGVLSAMIAALVGGTGPAEHACRIDPARTLSKE